MAYFSNEIDVLVGHNIRRIRVACGIDAAALADQIGVTEAAIASMESGRRRFSAENLRRICTHLRITPAALYTPRSED